MNPAKLLKTSQDHIANAGAIGVNALAGVSWLSDVELVLQVILTLIGIAAGVPTAMYQWHKWKTREQVREDVPKKPE